MTTLPPWLLSQGSLAAAAVAVLSHYLFWGRYELDAKFYLISFSILLCQPVAFLILVFYYGFSLVQALIIQTFLESVYFTTLFVYIGIYRLFFHRLRKFPGPFWARLWMWWKIKRLSRKERAYSEIYDLHQQYGDVVRVGPRELSIRHIDAIDAVYGGRSVCFKSAQYEFGVHESLQAIRDPKKHHYRRTIWDRGLNAKSVQQFLPRMNRLSNAFTSRVKEFKGQPFVVNELIHFLTFDVMGDLGFGKSFNQLETGEIHPGVALIAQWLSFAVYTMQIPWLITTLQYIPGIDDPTLALRAFAKKCLREREQVEPDQPDILSHIINAKEKEEEGAQTTRWPFTDADMISDTFTMSIAGSDTSYSALVHILYYMAKFPGLQSQLRAELQPLNLLQSPEEPPIWSQLNALPLLEAVILETLRMHPPVPLGLTRNTPRNAPITLIAGHAVPYDTMVSVPTYSLHHDLRYWVEPDLWIPERWVPGSEHASKIIDKRAFIPFSVGPMNCAGRAFAMMEMKCFVAKVMSGFEIGFGDETEGSELMEGHKDYLTWWCPDFRVRLTAL